MAAPTITSCSPSSGPKAGGTAVQIIGTEFTGATAVTFDGTNATRYAVVDATHILAVTPAGSGTGDVVVTTAGGTGTLTDGFTYAGIFATVDECASKAGDNVSTAGWTTANIEQWTSEAESYINVLTNHNFSDSYSSLNPDVKKILTEAVSNLVAIFGLSYKPSGEDGNMNRIEYEDRVNVLWARFQQCIDILKDERTPKFIDSQT